MTPEREKRFLEVLNKRQNTLTVVLENIADIHNISAILRTCDAVGIQEVYVLNTLENNPSTKFNLGKKSSASAKKWLDVKYIFNREECIAALRIKYKKIYTTRLSGETKSIFDLNLTESVALIFGNEHDGVSKEISALADGNFIIPQVGMIRSLNVSVACAVSLYEAFRQRKNKGMYDASQLPENEIAILLEKWKTI